MFKVVPSDCNLNGEYSSAFINGVLSLKENQQHEIRTTINHLVENTKSYQLIKSVLGKDSKSAYQRSKFAGEQKSLMNFKNTVIIRPSVVCGPEDNFTNLFSKLSFSPVIPIVGIDYKFQPIMVTDVADAIVKAIQVKKNEGKIYEIGGPTVISFGDMVKSIMRTINKKRFVIEMPMTIAKIQSSILSLLPIPPVLTRDQCEILSEADNVVSNKELTISDLEIKPKDVEQAMEKWLWRYRDGGQFAKAK